MNQDQVIAEGVPEEQGKFCADCKHLIGVRYKEEANNWNCGHPKNDLGFTEPNLVTGLKVRQFRHTISFQRYPTKAGIEVCGREGSWYEKYEKPSLEILNTIGGQESSELVFDANALEEGKKAVAARLEALKNRKKA